MFKKILIANRGEIACRIIKTAKRMGIQCVAVYSDIDANALHVTMADEAYLIGPAPSRESYLNISAIIAAAKQSGAEAIHPGYGFLSENAEFASACAAANIIFIGPSAAAITAMGSKSAAKKIMEAAHVPVIPGYHGDDQSEKALAIAANKIGYPLLIKATAGGGGKGMRLVNAEKEFTAALISAKRESKNSFADDRVLLEKYFPHCRHIEVQVFADQYNNAVYLFDRDCSIQRRHQKVIEEAPAPSVNETLRQQMGTAAIAAAKAIHYTNAGTIEFLLAENQQFYFMEMNTRLQVEHPITEMITGQDLVEWQLRIAAGEKLSFSQSQLKHQGHAFEARIYAEDPNNNFLPATGKIVYWQMPTQNENVRIDTGVSTGDEITVYYDPLIAKLIVWNKDRASALTSLQQALHQSQIIGLTTNLDFLSRITAQPDYNAAKFDTQYLDTYKDILLQQSEISAEIIAFASLFILLSQQQLTKQQAENSTDSYSPWFQHDHWRLNLIEPQLLHLTDSLSKKITVMVNPATDNYSLKINHKTLLVNGFLNGNELTGYIDGKALVGKIIRFGDELHLYINEQHYQLTLYNSTATATHFSDTDNLVTSPMPGTLVAVLAKPGQSVQKGDNLMIIEAMKMEHTIAAPTAGTIKTIHFQPGELINEGAELLEFETKA